jgi:hypothetical protein
VAVSADRLTGEIVRTVTELVLRHRYVLLDLPGGGEELCRQLRREYGVTLLLAPSAEQVRDAEIRVAFDRREWDRDLLCLRLYDESQPLPQLLRRVRKTAKISPVNSVGQRATAPRPSALPMPAP